MKNKKSSISYIRLLHAYPENTFIDLCLEKKILCKKTGYKDFSKYFPLPSGNHCFSLSLHKNKEAFYTKKFSILPQCIYTLVFAPKYKEQAPHLFLLEDPFTPLNKQRCFLRMANFYTPRTSFSVFVSDKPFLKTLTYGELSRYRPLEPSTYSFSLFNKQSHSAKEEPFYKIPPHLTKQGRFYSAYLIGNEKSKEHPLECLFAIDGNSYLRAFKKEDNPFL